MLLLLIAPTQWHVHMELTAPFQVSWNHCESIRPVFSVKSLISLLYYLCTIIVAVVTPKLSNTLPDQYWVHLTCHCSICFMYTLLSTWKVVWTHLNTVYSLQQSVSLSCMMSSSLALTGSQPVPQSGASGLLSVANGPSFCSLPPQRWPRLWWIEKQLAAGAIRAHYLLATNGRNMCWLPGAC